MKIQYKLIGILIVFLLVVGYVWYSQYTIKSLTNRNEKLATDLTTATTSNAAYQEILSSYEESLLEKEKVLEEAQRDLQKISEQLKGLKDEKTKAFLSTSTPSTVEQLLKSTDYYYKTSSNSTSK